MSPAVTHKDSNDNDEFCDESLMLLLATMEGLEIEKADQTNPDQAAQASKHLADLEHVKSQLIARIPGMGDRIKALTDRQGPENKGTERLDCEMADRVGGLSERHKRDKTDNKPNDKGHHRTRGVRRRQGKSGRDTRRMIKDRME